MRVRGNPRLRLLDRTFGAPILWALGRLPKRPAPGRIERLGILRTHAVGDTLLLQGILADARAALPDADIVLITGEDNAQAGALIVGRNARQLEVSVLSPLAAMARLQRERFNVLVDVSSWPRLDALLTATSGAHFRVGFRTRGQYRHYAFDRTVDHAPERHQVENYRALFRAIGVPSTSAPSLANAHLPAVSTPPSPFVVFHPWSGGFKGHNKEWPLDRWVRLGTLLKRHGSVVVTGAPANAAAAEHLSESLRSAGVEARSVAGHMTLAQTAALLASSLAVVSVNTGIMHLAAVLGVRTVTLDGPTSAKRWGAIGPRVTSVESALPGCGFLDLGFEYNGHRADCMLGIEVERVTNAVDKLIATT